MKAVSHVGLMTNAEILKEIGSRIKKERISQKLQQQDLAQKCDISIRAIQRVEQTGEISFMKLVMILRALNRLEQLSEFMDFSGELEELSYERFKDKTNLQLKKRVFNKDKSDKSW